MKNIRLLHISDIHFQGLASADEIPDDAVRARREASVNAVEWRRNRVLGDAWQKELARNRGKIDIVCLTGDVADWGLKSEYNQATTFLSELAFQLRIEIGQIFVVPGNHDVCRGRENTAWKALRDF